MSIVRAISPEIPEPAPGTWSNCLVAGGIAYVAGMTASGGDLTDEYTQAKGIFTKIRHLGAADHARIKAIDPAINLVDAGGWFDGEYRETWPAYSAARYLSPNSTGQGTREERDNLLAEAEVILGGWPFPLDLRARAPKLKWFHQRPAGASNLLLGDLWGSDVMVTTSRGAGNTLAMAEYALAGILYFAKSFDRAQADRGSGAFEHRAYRPLLIDGKTAC